MKYIQETTAWTAGYTVPNHTYYVDTSGRTAVGYIPQGSGRLVKFSKPLRLDTRGRKFTTLPQKGEPDSTYFKPEKEEAPTGSVQVQGSGGKVYTLTHVRGVWRCTCPGHTFRGSCKHTKELEGA